MNNSGKTWPFQDKGSSKSEDSSLCCTSSSLGPSSAEKVLLRSSLRNGGSLDPSIHQVESNGWVDSWRLIFGGHDPFFFLINTFVPI